MSRRGRVGPHSGWGPFLPHNVVQWLLVVPLVLGFLGGIGVYAYTSLLAPDSLTRGPDATYRWDGGTLVLKGALRRGGSCTVEPDDGPSRRVRAEYGLGRTVLEPWFSGAADVRCSTSTSVWLGQRAELAAVVLAPQAFWGFAVGTGVLVVAYLLAAPKRVRPARQPR